MVWGVLERNINFLKAASARNRYRVTLEMIADFIMETQKSKLDAHLITGGQNGAGKSYYQLAQTKVFLKRRGLPLSFAEALKANSLRFFYVYDTRDRMIEALKECKNAVFMIDELKPFFDYKRSMTVDQTELYNMVEVARSHNNVFVGAARDYTKIDVNYRNAKAQLLIYLFDKVVDYTKLDEHGYYKTLFSYGSVFVGNPSLEYEDKFMFSTLRGYSMETTKYLAEKLPTWVGNIVVENVSKYGVTPEDISIYEREKESGIQRYEYKAKSKKRALTEDEEVEAYG